MSSIALSGSQIYISGFVFVFKDTFLDMCTMAKIKKHERENKMIACRSRPSPAHRTSPSGGSRRGGGGAVRPRMVGTRGRGRGWGAPGCHTAAAGSAKALVDVFGGGGRRRKETPNAKGISVG